MSDCMGYYTTCLKINSCPTMSEMSGLLKQLHGFSVGESLGGVVPAEESQAASDDNGERQTLQAATARLNGLVMKDATLKLAEILKCTSDPAGAKKQLADTFPLSPSELLPDLANMVQSVAAIVAFDVALDLDADKLESTTSALALNARQYAAVVSFDPDLVAKVAPELAQKMTVFVERYTNSLATLVGEGSPLVKEYRDFSAKIEEYWFLFETSAL